MTSTLIRRLINCGCDPDKAQSLCFVYIKGSSLSVLESKISEIEKGKQDVDTLQSESHWPKCGGLLCESNI